MAPIESPETTPARAALNGSDPAKHAERKTPAKLRADQTRALVHAQSRYDKAKRELDEARAARDEVLTKLLPKFELGKWITSAGWAIRITMQPSGRRFSLGRYLEAGHKVTTAMAPFISEGDAHPRVWIKPSE